MRSIGSVLLVAVAFVFAAPIHSAAAPKIQTAESATQFYMRWRNTVLNAKSSDEIVPFFNAEMKEEFSMAAATDKADMLATIKRAFGTQTDFKIVKETTTPSGVTLSLEALDAEKKPIVGSVDVVKENGAWKVSNAAERWKPKG